VLNVASAIIRYGLVVLGIYVFAGTFQEAFKPSSLTPEIWAHHRHALYPLYAPMLIAQGINGLSWMCIGLSFPFGMPWPDSPPHLSTSQWHLLSIIGGVGAGVSLAVMYVANAFIKRCLRRVLSAEDYDNLFPQRYG